MPAASLADLETRQLIAIFLIVVMAVAATGWGVRIRAKARHRKARLRGDSAAKKRELSGK